MKRRWSRGRGAHFRFDSGWYLAAVEIVEIPGHPFFIGCQFHPEFKSKPLEPHPLFKAFTGAAYEHGQKKKVLKDAAEVEMFLRPEKMGRR